MSGSYTILLLEDEPLILMDLEYTAIERGCQVVGTISCKEALEAIAAPNAIHGAILDVSLGEGQTCLPVAKVLEERGIPFILHSGDLDRHEERIRDLKANLVAKPCPSDKVISALIAHIEGDDQQSLRQAAE